MIFGHLLVVGEGLHEDGRVAIELRGAYVSGPRLISRTRRAREVFSRARPAAAASCAFANSTLVFLPSTAIKDLPVLGRVLGDEMEGAAPDCG